MLKIERETVISMNDEEVFATVPTRQQRIKTLLQKRGHKIYKQQVDYVVYRIPKRCISIRAAAKPKIKE